MKDRRYASTNAIAAGQSRQDAGDADGESWRVRHGRTVAEAFILMYYLEKSCEVQLKALSSGKELIKVTEEVSEYSARLRYSEEQLTANPGALEWQALVRKLDSEDPSYRD